jgi:hypothetical protein
MPRNTETVESLFERQRGTLPDTFGLRPLSVVTGAPIPAGIGLARERGPGTPGLGAPRASRL